MDAKHIARIMRNLFNTLKHYEQRWNKNTEEINSYDNAHGEDIENNMASLLKVRHSLFTNIAEIIECSDQFHDEFFSTIGDAAIVEDMDICREFSMEIKDLINETNYS